MGVGASLPPAPSEELIDPEAPMLLEDPRLHEELACKELLN